MNKFIYMDYLIQQCAARFVGTKPIWHLARSMLYRQSGLSSVTEATLLEQNLSGILPSPLCSDKVDSAALPKPLCWNKTYLASCRVHFAPTKWAQQRYRSHFVGAAPIWHLAESMLHRQRGSGSVTKPTLSL